ncbi:MAG TPA: ATP-binding cassette domain-containing protein [Spirochaetota bacterium]|nr:ATP-binding cassette domain-containing protein [Spirochaetota bacterium]HQO03281.1 ATP-binding cassette domain-containing protein [Spirochaetota bacterium]
MIRIQNLTISFDDIRILENINIEVAKGDLLVILGKNGCGKSLLMKSIAGLIQHYSGSIFIDDTDILNMSTQKTSMSVYGYVFQKGGLFDSMSVYDNIAFGMRRNNTEEETIRTTITRLLKRVGLQGSEDKVPSELSGGMQKRVGLARAICQNPDIILYDDPTAGLDPILSDSIADLILDIKNNNRTTSIVATHDLKVAQKIADRIALIYNGSIVFSGTSNDFFSNNNEFARQFINGDIEGPIDIY